MLNFFHDEVKFVPSVKTFECVWCLTLGRVATLRTDRRVGPRWTLAALVGKSEERAESVKGGPED